MQKLTSTTMRDTTQLLTNLRKVMLKPPSYDQPIGAYIIPSDDAHQSEYICERDERRSYISGFDGSAGTAVITNDKALLWTDGRYYQQATKQLDGNWTLMKDGQPTTPSIGKWLAKYLPKGSHVGTDPKLMSYRVWKPLNNDLQSNDCELVGIEQNLIDLIWQNQPDGPKNKAITLATSFNGKTIKDKWNEVITAMNEKRTNILVISALDEIAWFLNMRGSDIEYNPVFFAYLIITKTDILLFIDSSKLPDDFQEHQKENGVKITISEYNDIKNCVQELVVKQSDQKIWIAETSSYFLTSLIPKKILHQEVTPLTTLKAIKNKTEAEGFINCHIRDGVALCQYFAWLEKSVKNGDYVDEISGATKLEQLRSTKDHYMGLSFATISSSGPNASVIHYHPAVDTNRQINNKEIYLCDSGAQYRDGTTDTTRTLHFGEPTDFEMETYTRVLKGQLKLGTTIFPNKVKGQFLDTLARKALWDVGLDYGHGTGHGVGHFLNVHEGPMGVGVRLMPDDPGLQENMFISNEPGFYQEGEFGIRIEDIVQIIPTATKYNFPGHSSWLTFKTITMCPKQTKLIKKDMLTNEEIEILNNYHKLVKDTLSPILGREKDLLTLEWLERETQPI